MGYLRQLNSNADQQAFPGALFEITGEVPEAQCSEAKLEGDDVTILNAPPQILDPGKFAGWSLIGKYFTITRGPPDAPQTRRIDTHTDNYIQGVPPPLFWDGQGDYYVHNGGSLILTRNVLSFAEYIHAAGYAYTIKGGKLYTDIPEDLLQPACSILFDPLS